MPFLKAFSPRVLQIDEILCIYEYVATFLGSLHVEGKSWKREHTQLALTVPK